jgi:integrase
MSTLSYRDADDARPSLRLFSPAAEPADAGSTRISPATTLAVFFRHYALPRAGKACNWSPKTVVAYERSIDYWTELTRDRSLADIDDAETAEFVAGLRLLPGRASEFMSAANQRKHCRHVQSFLNMAGPRVRCGKKDLRRFGAGLVAEPAFIEMPDADEQLPDGDFTHAEVTAILAACKTMTTPHLPSVVPRAWWEALIVFLAATGMRIGATMELEWSMLDGDNLLHVPAAICKRRRPDVKYVHPAARAKIEAIRGVGPRIFPWPNWPNPGATRWLQRQREFLLARAGLPEERQFGFHGFRKYHATELFERDELAARDSLNHRDVETTRTSYANHRRQADAKLRRQKAAIDQLPLFREPLD